MMRIGTAPGLLLLAAMLGAASGCGAGRDTADWSEVEPGLARGYNLLLVTLDTVRRDRIGCYGYERAYTPHIDSLAAGGVRFDDAVASAPLTLPSHATLLTGLYPPGHGVRDNGRHRLAPERATLAKDLKADGYDTAAFIGCFVLDERFGLAEGFDLYDFQVTANGLRPHMPDFNERRADEVTDAALDWLETRGADPDPFFLWVHYFDPHRPYTSPLASDPRFAGEPYDAEIAFTDEQLGRLLAALERMELRERTVVVLTADHGESFGEHGEPTHGLFIYEGTIRVPLIVSAPGLIAGARVVDDRIAGLVDVRSTMKELLGTDAAQENDGRSLLGPAPAADRAIYIESFAPFYIGGWSPLQGLRTRGGKFIHAPRPEFYDLSEDRDEARNLYEARPAGLGPLESRLAELTRRWESRAAPEEPMSDDEIERLEALGYVRGGSGASPGSDLRDPKEMVGAYQEGLQAEAAYVEGRYEDAARMASAVLAESPGYYQASRVLAYSYLELGRPKEALHVLREAVEANHEPFLCRSLVQFLIIRGLLDEAEEALSLYESVAPRDGRVPMYRGDCLATRGRFEDAIAQFERAIEMDPNRVGIPARERIQRVEKMIAAREAQARAR